MGEIRIHHSATVAGGCALGTRRPLPSSPRSRPVGKLGRPALARAHLAAATARAMPACSSCAASPAPPPPPSDVT
eukprot:scaffold8585_cov36-Phaeocystis_antarctica.AAC.1